MSWIQKVRILLGILSALGMIGIVVFALLDMLSRFNKEDVAFFGIIVCAEISLISAILMILTDTNGGNHHEHQQNTDEV